MRSKGEKKAAPKVERPNELTFKILFAGNGSIVFGSGRFGGYFSRSLFCGSLFLYRLFCRSCGSFGSGRFLLHAFVIANHYARRRVQSATAEGGS